MAININPTALQDAQIEPSMDILVRKTGDLTPSSMHNHSVFWQKTDQVDGILHTELTRLTPTPKFKDANGPDADYVTLQGTFCLNDGTPFNGRCEIRYSKSGSPMVHVFEFAVTAGVIGAANASDVQIPLEVLEGQIEWVFYCKSDYNYRYDPAMIPCIDDPIGVRFPETMGLEGSYVGGEVFDADYVMVNCECYPGSMISVEVEVDDGGYNNRYPILTVNAWANSFQGQAGDGYWDPNTGNNKQYTYFPLFQWEGYTVIPGDRLGDNKVWLEGTALPTILLHDDVWADIYTTIHLPVYDTPVNLVLTYELDLSTYEFRYVDSYIM